MNTLGIALLWCAVQVTLIGLLASGLYVLFRWLRPAAAGPVVLTGLVIIVVLSLLAISPWPRWTISKLAPSPGEPTGAARTVRPSADEFVHDSPWTPTGEGQGTGAGDRGTVSSGTGTSSAVSFWQAIREALLRPQAAGPESAWRWPATIAALLFAALLCGLVRLVLSVAAVDRVWFRSRPVLDGEISELVDVLRAELGCRRPIEVRQSDELVTAATIGWLRPVVLLPADWRSWTTEQRHAVLAHEVAHAQSHDLLALFCGQLGLVLHFYHPLVHWLVSRLRLEQELAADTAAAGISGGRWKYLTTIAELALRQQDHPLSWSAQTFLPTQNTFLRRIAMLRDSKLRLDRLSPVSRLLIMGLVLLGGLLVAGLRVPAGPSAALADDAVKAAAEEPSTSPGEGPASEIRQKSEQTVLSHVGESSTDKRSFADSGFAVAFERPAEMKSIVAVKLFCQRYGYPEPPKEKFHIYLLDQDQKVLEQISVPYGKAQWGEMKWQTFEFPAVQVPEKFYVALWFNAESTKGVYIGMDKNVEQSHSWIGLPDQGYHRVEEKYDWMIAAVVSSEEGKEPSRPKVKTYEPEKATDTETTEALPRRTWNDSTGAFSLEAEFAGVENGKVKLKKADGKIYAIPLDRLSKKDQDYVAQQSGGSRKAVGKQRQDGQQVEHRGRRPRREISSGRGFLVRHLGEPARVALRGSPPAPGKFPRLDLQRAIPTHRHVPVPLQLVHPRRARLEVLPHPAHAGPLHVHRLLRIQSAPDQGRFRQL
jgi:beta-lactamase regulating signal transducer with metallopeptidase domain